MTQQQIAPRTTSPSLVTRMAERFGVDASQMLNTLKQTAFKQRGDKVVSNEQMMALLVVAEQYGLNPWTKEIFAFDDKNMGIIPVVSVDGWLRIINSHPDFAGMEFRYSDTTTKPADGKDCPEWCEAVLYRRDRDRPIVIREYLDEVYVGKRNGYAGPWQTHTKRMLRWKTLIQGSRVAFGFAGIYDEDEAGRIIDGEASRVDPRQAQANTAGTVSVAQRIIEARTTATPAADPDPASVDGGVTADGAQDDVFDAEITLEAILEAMRAAPDMDALNDAADLGRLLPEHAPAISAEYQVQVDRIELGGA